jgi:hypothetical protein
MTTALVMVACGVLGFAGAGPWAPTNPRGAPGVRRSRPAPLLPGALPLLFASVGLCVAWALFP